MNTPICDFVKEYALSRKLRLHMPGHKGKSFFGGELFDITEIDGADVLYNAKGIIKQSEENASSLFGTRQTLYSAEGSSLAIRAMLYLAMIHAKALRAFILLSKFIIRLPQIHNSCDISVKDIFYPVADKAGI